MEIQVKDLKPNPFRKMKSYPINREKVESLKISINETTFWDNILVRPGKGVVWVEEDDEHSRMSHGIIGHYSFEVCDKDGNFEDYENPFFEIAYGHHRMIALKELGIEEVDIPIRDLDDGQMIRIMANENLDDWKTTPAIYTETVLVAKEYLDGELAKYESWEELQERPDLINLLEVYLTINVDLKQLKEWA